VRKQAWVETQPRSNHGTFNTRWRSKRCRPEVKYTKPSDISIFFFSESDPHRSCLPCLLTVKDCRSCLHLALRTTVSQLPKQKAADLEMAVQALSTSKPGGKDSVGPAGASGRRELTEHPTSSPPQPLCFVDRRRTDGTPTRGAAQPRPRVGGRSWWGWVALPAASDEHARARSATILSPGASGAAGITPAFTRNIEQQKTKQNEPCLPLAGNRAAPAHPSRRAGRDRRCWERSQNERGSAGSKPRGGFEVRPVHQKINKTQSSHR
jgi:hypothetical protein